MNEMVCCCANGSGSIKLLSARRKESVLAVLAPVLVPGACHIASVSLAVSPIDKSLRRRTKKVAPFWLALSTESNGPRLDLDIQIIDFFLSLEKDGMVGRTASLCRRRPP
jgi:hypothetical protein